MSRSRTAGSLTIVSSTRTWLVKKVHRAGMSTVITLPFPDGTKANTRTPGPKPETWLAYRPRFRAAVAGLHGNRQRSPSGFRPSASSVAAQVIGQHHPGRDPAWPRSSTRTSRTQKSVIVGLTLGRPPGGVGALVLPGEEGRLRLCRRASGGSPRWPGRGGWPRANRSLRCRRSDRGAHARHLRAAVMNGHFDAVRVRGQVQGAGALIASIRSSRSLDRRCPVLSARLAPRAAAR